MYSPNAVSQCRERSPIGPLTLLCAATICKSYTVLAAIAIPPGRHCKTLSDGPYQEAGGSVETTAGGRAARQGDGAGLPADADAVLLPSRAVQQQGSAARVITVHCRYQHKCCSCLHNHSAEAAARAQGIDASLLVGASPAARGRCRRCRHLACPHVLNHLKNQAAMSPNLCRCFQTTHLRRVEAAGPSDAFGGQEHCRRRQRGGRRCGEASGREAREGRSGAG